MALVDQCVHTPVLLHTPVCSLNQLMKWDTFRICEYLRFQTWIKNDRSKKHLHDPLKVVLIPVIDDGCSTGLSVFEEEENQQKWAKQPLSSRIETPYNLLVPVRGGQKVTESWSAKNCRRQKMSSGRKSVTTKWQQALNQGDFNNTAESAAVLPSDPWRKKQSGTIQRLEQGRP